MRISRLYTDQALNKGATISLDTDQTHYLKNVLRLKANQTITLFNGNHFEYQAQIINIQRNEARVKIVDTKEQNNESSLLIHLGMAIAKNDKMDWAIQKAVELGVNQISPIISQRTVVKFKTEDKKQHKCEHWQKIIRNAAEQSHRNYLPALTAISQYKQWLNDQHGLKIFLDPTAEAFMSELQPQENKLTLLTGPEGGFDLQEKQWAIASGFIPVRLGARVLRTETASLAAISAAQTLWGDFCNRGRND